MRSLKFILAVFLITPLIVKADKVVTTGEDTNINIVVGDVESIDEVSDVEIKWKQMIFTYNVVENYTWNSETHKYEKNPTKTYWTNNGNSITISNKTANRISITPKYFSKIDYVKGKFSLNNLNLEAHSTKEIKFELSGSINQSNNNTKVGYITIEIE